MQVRNANVSQGEWPECRPQAGLEHCGQEGKKPAVLGDSRLERHQRKQCYAAGERLLPTGELISSLDGFLHRSWVAEG